MTTNRPPETRGKSDRKEFGDVVGRKAERKIKGREDRKRSPMFWAGMFGMVGWAVSLPMVVLIYVGHLLDKNYPGPIPYRLNGVLLGMALGCLNAWYWVRRESKREE